MLRNLIIVAIFSLISVKALILKDTSFLKERNLTIFNSNVCNSLKEFTPHIREQIRNTTKDVQKIIDYIVNGTDRGNTYNELSIFVDKFGSRLAGTKSLEDSIDYMLNKLKKDGHDNVHTENATFVPWTRGQEWARMITPRNKSLAILSLGGSVGTGKKVITAQVLVVKTFDELKQRANEAKGKFVVYNFDFHSYFEQNAYRAKGANEAAKYGAVGALIRSLTPLSINSPHTGIQKYEDNVTFIPGVSITVEDAELFYRLDRRGENITVQLYMEAENQKVSTTRNVISEITGTELPEQIVVVSGHLDSWDVGQGAMDDGGGAFISWRVLSVLKKLGLKTKRTIRSILWATEEYDDNGLVDYLKAHNKELKNWSIAMTSDLGTFTPTGLSLFGNNKITQCIVSEVLQLLKPINATELFIPVSDKTPSLDYSFPVGSLETNLEKYFYFHHTDGDTMTVEDSHDLDLSLAVWTATSYVFATIDELLPR